MKQVNAKFAKFMQHIVAIVVAAAAAAVCVMRLGVY